MSVAISSFVFKFKILTDNELLLNELLIKVATEPTIRDLDILKGIWNAEGIDLNTSLAFDDFIKTSNLQNNLSCIQSNKE